MQCFVEQLVSNLMVHKISYAIISLCSSLLFFWVFFSWMALDVGTYLDQYIIAEIVVGGLYTALTTRLSYTDYLAMMDQVEWLRSPGWAWRATLGAGIAMACNTVVRLVLIHPRAGLKEGQRQTEIAQV